LRLRAQVLGEIAQDGLADIQLAISASGDLLDESSEVERVLVALILAMSWPVAGCPRPGCVAVARTRRHSKTPAPCGDDPGHVFAGARLLQRDSRQVGEQAEYLHISMLNAASSALSSNSRTPITRSA